MTVWKWSQTAASNATSDTTVNYREGQTPGSLNDAGRAVMAAVAKFRDDLACVTLTGGTNTDYTLTSNQGFTSLSDGLTIGFELDQDCGDDPTIDVDGLGAVALAPYSGGAFVAGELQGGGKYRATYDASGSGSWVLHSMRVGVTALESGGTGASLSDPGADRMLFWDDSAGAVVWLAPGTGLATSGTSLALSHLGLESLADPGADAILAWDDSGTATAFFTFGDGIESNGTTVQANIASQSEMEAAAATDVLVPVGRQKHHPSHPKAFGKTAVIGTQAIVVSHGYSSVTDLGVGLSRITLSTAMATADYAIFGAARGQSSGSYGGRIFFCVYGAEDPTATTFVFNTGNTDDGTLDCPHAFTCIIGDQ